MKRVFNRDKVIFLGHQPVMFDKGMIVNVIKKDNRTFVKHPLNDFINIRIQEKYLDKVLIFGQEVE